MKFDFSDLKGKVAVIAGGAGVIGYAVCEAMASAGIKTAIIDINLSSLNQCQTLFGCADTII